MALLMMYPDIDAEQKIKNYQKELYENGIYSHCFKFDIEPHITVGRFDVPDLDKANETLKTCCSKIKRFKIRFGSIGLFNHNNPAVFLVPDTTEILLETYKYLHKTFHDCAVDGDYWCGRWLPHCTVNEYPDDTVEHDVRLDVICKSTEYLMKTFKAFEAFISVGFAEYSPERFELML